MLQIIIFCLKFYVYFFYRNVSSTVPKRQIIWNDEVLLEIDLSTYLLSLSAADFFYTLQFDDIQDVLWISSGNFGQIIDCMTSLNWISQLGPWGFCQRVHIVLFFETNVNHYKQK